MASAQCFPSTSDISPISWLFKKVKKKKEKMKDPKELRAILLKDVVYYFGSSKRQGEGEEEATNNKHNVLLSVQLSV